MRPLTAAARQGIRTALVQDRPVLGGNASTEIRVPPVGATLCNFAYSRETGLIEELFLNNLRRNPTWCPEGWNLEMESLVRNEPHLDLFLNSAVCDVSMNAAKDRVESVKAYCAINAEDFGPFRPVCEHFFPDTGGFTEAERRVVYSAMMIGLDDSVGRVLAALKETGQEQNTIVLLNYTPPELKWPHEARADGQVLEVRWAAPQHSAKAWLAIPLKRNGQVKEKHLPAESDVCTPGDCLVYDMKIESMQAGQTAYISPLRGEPVFSGNHGTGVDASGTRVSSTENLPGPLNEWKRYVLGLGYSAASSLSDLRLVIESKVKGDVRVLIDNVQILKPDGQVIPVWNGGDAPPGQAALTCKAIQLKPTNR